MVENFQKTRRELRNFERFRNLSALKIVAGSAWKLDPPDPDIRCQVENEGFAWFELTEACSPQFAQAEHHPVQTSVWLANEIEQKVERKLLHDYSGSAPVYLLVYLDGRHALTDHALKCHVEHVVAQHGRGSFRKIWVMGETGLYDV